MLSRGCSSRVPGRRPSSSVPTRCRRSPSGPHFPNHLESVAQKTRPGAGGWPVAGLRRCLRGQYGTALRPLRQDCPVSRKHPCRGRRQGFFPTTRAALSYLRVSVARMVSRPAHPCLDPGREPLFRSTYRGATSAFTWVCLQKVFDSSREREASLSSGQSHSDGTRTQGG